MYKYFNKNSEASNISPGAQNTNFVNTYSIQAGLKIESFQGKKP